MTSEIVLSISVSQCSAIFIQEERIRDYYMHMMILNWTKICILIKCTWLQCISDSQHFKYDLISFIQYTILYFQNSELRGLCQGKIKVTFPLATSDDSFESYDFKKMPKHTGTCGISGINIYHLAHSTCPFISFSTFEFLCLKFLSMKCQVFK